MTGVTLSKEHGVNPAVSFCPVCGKDMDVVLFGRLPGDKEAPRKVPSTDPCSECKEEIESYKNLGVTFIVIHDEFHKYKDKPNVSPWQFFHSLSVLKREAADEITSGFTKDKDVVFTDLSAAKKVGIVKEDGSLKNEV